MFGLTLVLAAISDYLSSYLVDNRKCWFLAVSQTSPMYCRYLPSGEVGTKLYCLVTEAHVCEQLAQGRYLAVHRAGLEPSSTCYKFETLQLQYTIKPNN